VALGLRLLEESARSDDPDYSLDRSIAAGRLLGPGVAGAITTLQHAGKLPPCGSPEWARLVDHAEHGQVSIAPVLLIGDDEYACEDVVEARVRGKAGPPPLPAPMPAARAEPVSLQDEFRNMGLI
jgi:hypothetical protein